MTKSSHGEDVQVNAEKQTVSDRKDVPSVCKLKRGMGNPAVGRLAV